MTRIRFFENLLFCSDVDDAVLEDCRLNSIQLLDLFGIVLEFVALLLVLMFAWLLLLMFVALA